mgnify:CR=1 FL=1
MKTDNFTSRFENLAAQRLGTESRPVDQVIKPAETDPLLAPETERFDLRVSVQLKEEFKAAAAAHGLKHSAALKQLMSQYVKDWKEEQRRK